MEDEKKDKEKSQKPIRLGEELNNARQLEAEKKLDEKSQKRDLKFICYLLKSVLTAILQRKTNTILKMFSENLTSS